MPIQILPPRLANQIAAGEVVERPASVVKELVENSLDSGATKIEIEIEKGGHKRILVRDNGVGIPEQELSLALSRHATSKISCLDDLEAIASLGFRGEALASISSVSRLSITSKPKQQTQAWQAHCEGRDMQVQMNPVAHPDGTCVDVADLFFNTPARRKFLKTEKTEFSHIDEIIRRIALSRFDLGFSVKHNGKIVRKYPAIATGGNNKKRLDDVCGKGKYPDCVELNSQYQNFELSGWLMPVMGDETNPEYQYFYVNGRVMRDKLINHAIRQTLEELAYPNLNLAYVLYFTLPADQLDVNVHPAKHEVRFHQGRLVHDFIYRALMEGLTQFLQGQQLGADTLSQASHELPPAEPNHDYIQPLQRDTGSHVDESGASYSARSEAYIGQAANGYGSPRLANASAGPQASGSFQCYQELMTSEQPVQELSVEPGRWLRVNERTILVSVNDKYFLLPITTLNYQVLAYTFEHALPVSQPLLMPVSIQADESQIESAKRLYDGLLASSVEIGWTPNRILLRKVPALFRHFPWAECMHALLSCQSKSDLDVREHLLNVLINENNTYSNLSVQQLWSKFVTNHTDIATTLGDIGKPIPLSNWLNLDE